MSSTSSPLMAASVGAGTLRYRSWLPLSVLLLGLVSMGLILGAARFHQGSTVRHLRYLEALGEIRESVALSHLWFEEYVSGDDVDVAEIYTLLDHARDLVQGLLGASPTSRSTDGAPLPKLRTPDLLGLAETLRQRLDLLRRITVERHNGLLEGRTMGVGSPMDTRYDQIFHTVIEGADRLEERLTADMQTAYQRDWLVLSGILLTWAFVLAMAALGLRTLERRRRQAETALRESQAHLFQTQKMDAVGRLAGGLAHDINNYLAALRGHCELVSMKHAEDAWIGRKMAAALRIADKASNLLERLQTFRRKQPLQLEVLVPNRLIEALQVVMRPSLREDVLRVLDLEPAGWRIEIDPSHLEQILVNLILNAQDAMPQGGTLILRSRNLPAAGDRPERVQIEVEDTGTGIPPAVVDRIFEPFFTTKGSDQRHGLGLAIVYTVVQQNQGRVEVVSTEGRGTTFRLTFPRSTKPESQALEDQTVAAEELRGEECLLLVDDNDEFRHATAELLASYGYRVLPANGGEEALEIYRQYSDEIELVVTDVVMPGLSGPEVVARLREQGPVHALFLSAYTDQITVVHGIREQDDHFLSKLASAQSLVRRVRAMLDQDGPESRRSPSLEHAGDGVFHGEKTT